MAKPAIEGARPARMYNSNRNTWSINSIALSPTEAKLYPAFVGQWMEKGERRGSAVME